MPSTAQEESNLLAPYEKGEWMSVKNLETKVNRYQKIAQATITKDKRINIRIVTKDLTAPTNAGVRVNRDELQF